MEKANLLDVDQKTINSDISNPVDKIKEILFQSELNKIDDYLDDLKSHISNIESDNYKDELVIKSLSKAIDVNAKGSNNSLAQSLAPIISASLLEQVKNDRDKIIDALYPVMGSIITKFMSASIKELTDSINQKIEQKLSVASVVRKIQSKVTGVSEAEILFKKNIGAKFQSIYLIHKKTGVLIAETHSGSFTSENGHMIAGMFSAITSFVDDWISKSEDMAMLDGIDYGNMKIVFEKSSSYIVAAVVEGQDVGQLRAPLQKLLSLIHLDFSHHFKNFTGDVSEVPAEITDSLNSILSIDKAQKANDTHGEKNKLLISLVGAVLLVIFIWYGYGEYSNYQESKKYNNIIAKHSMFKKMPIKIFVNGKTIMAKGFVANQLVKNNLESTIKKHTLKWQEVNMDKLKILNVGYNAEIN